MANKDKEKARAYDRDYHKRVGHLRSFKRRTVSMSVRTHARFRRWSLRTGESMSGTAEALVRAFLDAQGEPRVSLSEAVSEAQRGYKRKKPASGVHMM